ncbi:hypothetical protein [Pontibacter roseus]|uniref:hypothetical protein n=1 Tax=Pontibacter roseus TaxID=336989 RepID=UPI000374843B|nr:hypothetical protein [Pontibacter roseus]
MGTIKQHSEHAYSDTPLEAAADRYAFLRRVLYTLAFGHIVLAIYLSYTDGDLYHAYTTEDGYIEHATAFLLLLTSFLCLNRALSATQRTPMAFFYLASALFFFGFGEEISWGQRLLGFATPEGMQQVNEQQEFTLHNIQVYDVSLNRLVFSLGLYTGVFTYFLLFPILYRRKAWFRKQVHKIDLPIPTYVQSLLYFVCFFCVLLIQQGRKWELQEFVLASFIFFAFLFPSNRLGVQR